MHLFVCLFVVTVEGECNLSMCACVCVLKCICTHSSVSEFWAVPFLHHVIFLEDLLGSVQSIFLNVST